MKKFGIALIVLILSVASFAQVSGATGTFGKLYSAPSDLFKTTPNAFLVRTVNG